MDFSPNAPNILHGALRCATTHPNTVQLREIVGARRPQSFGVYSNLIGAVPLRRMASQLN